jgi:hypothetical protein
MLPQWCGVGAWVRPILSGCTKTRTVGKETRSQACECVRAMRERGKRCHMH